MKRYRIESVDANVELVPMEDGALVFHSDLVALLKRVLPHVALAGVMTSSEKMSLEALELMKEIQSIIGE